jgi:hypothetical protein
MRFSLFLERDMRQHSTMIPLAALALGASAAAAGAQPCELRWSDEFEVGADDRVLALQATPHGLYAGGYFLTIGGTAAAGVARYEDGSWAPLGPGLGGAGAPVTSLLDVDLPFASGLVAGGAWAVDLWEGAAWRFLGSLWAGLACDPGCTYAAAAAVFDDGRGPALYVAGSFDEPGHGIARWDGQWEELGAGLAGLFGTGIGSGRSLATHDDGSGPALYVGGFIHRAGGVEVRNIARWRSTGWTDVGGGLGMPTAALAEFEIDGRPQLIAGLAGSEGEVWRWDGAVWTRMGGSFNGDVNALAVFDDGTGAALYAGGVFSAYDGRTLRGLARWDGAEWVEAAGGVSGRVAALEVQPYGGAWSLVVGGAFGSVGAGVPSQNIARLIGCAPACYADCDGGGSLDFFDFLCFQNLFAALDPAADCDGDTQFTFFDFLCFQNAFAAGCP